MTIYKERIPAYLIRERKNILEIKPNAPAPGNVKSYENEDEAWFCEYLLPLVFKLDSTSLYQNFKLKCSEMGLSQILMDYIYIRALRNMIHHANDSSTTSQKDIEETLVNAGYKRLEDVRLDDVKKTLLDSLEHLKISEGNGKRK